MPLFWSVLFQRGFIEAHTHPGTGEIVIACCCRRGFPPYALVKYLLRQLNNKSIVDYEDDCFMQLFIIQEVD